MTRRRDEPWSDVTPERRRIMAAIRSRDTKPEVFVRRMLHRLGYRFRVDKRQFGWRPDVLFPGRRKAIFIHGCFWHAHQPCSTWRPPKTRSEIWEAKLAKNRERDLRTIADFAREGWDTLVLWECELRSENVVAQRLVDFLGATRCNGLHLIGETKNGGDRDAGQQRED
jgi:DNA mismatch endonuclease, patch repair protein